MGETGAGFIIRGGTVFTCDPQWRIIPRGAVVLEGDLIVDVGRSDAIKRDEAKQEIDATHQIVLPGFIDGHCHSQGILSRSLVLRSHEPMAWKTIMHPFEEAMTSTMAKVSASLCCLELLRTGATCFVEFPAYNVANVDAVGEAVQATGMRCVVGRGSKDQVSPLDPKEQLVGMEDLGDALKQNEAFIQRWHGQAEGRIQAWIGLPGLLNCSDVAFQANHQLARRYEVLFGAHVASNPVDVMYTQGRWGSRPFQHLQDLGVLDEYFLGIHGVYIGEDEIPILASSGMHLVHCPRTYLRPTTKVPQLLRAGVNVVLGSDSMNYSPLVMARLASVLQERAWGVPYQDFKVLLPQEVIAMITRRAARAIHQDQEIGSLEVGKKADLIIMKANHPTWTPKVDLAEELLQLASPTLVDTVMVDGRIIMEHGVITTLDEQAILQQAQTITDEIATHIK